MRLWPARRLRAAACGTYPSSSAARWTRRRVGSLIRTALVLFRTYETVARETPARRATSALVGTVRCVGADGADCFGICTMTGRILAEPRHAAPRREKPAGTRWLELPLPQRMFDNPYRTARPEVTVR